MTITLTIRPEAEAELARQAASVGRALEAYAATLLEEAAHLAPEPSNGEAQPSKRQNLADFLMQSPLRGSGLKVERLNDYPRPVEL